MQKNPTKMHFPIASMLCSAFGHDYVITKNVTNHIHEYKCSKCGREVTDGVSGKLETLTTKAKLINESVASFFIKKSSNVGATS